MNILDFLKKSLKNNRKKAILNLLTALFVGVLLIVIGNMFFKNSNSNSEKGAADLNYEKNKIVSNSETYSDYAEKTERKLEQNLAVVEGVGNVKAMVTLKSGREIVVAEESAVSDAKNIENGGSVVKENSEMKQERKSILNSNDEPIILKEIEPKIEGVVIIAQGGGNVEVKNSIIRAVQALLGLEAHKIEVLKMK